MAKLETLNAESLIDALLHADPELSAEDFSIEEVESESEEGDSSDPRVVVMQMGDDAACSFVFMNNGKTIVLTMPFSECSVDLDFVNVFNMNVVNSCCFVDDEGDLTFRATFNVEGGVSDKRLAAFLKDVTADMETLTELLNEYAEDETDDE